MRLVYATAYQCDACGKIESVTASTTDKWVETPMPHGWLPSKHENLQWQLIVTLADRSVRMNCADICNECLQLPMDRVLQKVFERSIYLAS